MTNHGHDIASVLDADPDLGEGLNDEQLALASAQAYAQSRCYPRGGWRAPQEVHPTASLGLLITRGFILRELTVAGYTCAELLGPGDLFQPWLSPVLELSGAVGVEWTVVQRMRVLVIDRSFLERVASWPEIIAAICGRAIVRSHWLAFQLGLSGLRRIDDRVLLMLRQFADRWGTVTPDGVLLDIPLTHERLASLVGGRRPSVSAAVRRLIDRQQIQSRPRSRWLLLRQPDRWHH